MAESINVVYYVKTKGKTGLIKLILMEKKPSTIYKSSANE